MIKTLNPLKSSTYEYELPKNQIASYPISPANEAKMLVYDRALNTITHSTFKYLYDFLPTNTCVLLNDTKVIKARIFGAKKSGGKIEVFILNPLNEHNFKAYIKGKVKQNTTIFISNDITLHVNEIFDDGSKNVCFLYKNQKMIISEVYNLLEKIGHIPLPPYIKREDEMHDEKDYQSLFAKKQGAVAAPTASLHFTPKMFEYLQQNYEHAYVTLHVGAGTFKGVDVDDILEHKMHEEYFEISPSALDILKSEKNILAIGTTVTRVAEEFTRSGKEQGFCKLFLHPNNKPLRINHLLTNFHLPKSTLLMLVASFVGVEKTLKLYDEAIKNQYRFYSYGDAMLII